MRSQTPPSPSAKRYFHDRRDGKDDGGRASTEHAIWSMPYVISQLQDPMELAIFAKLRAAKVSEGDTFKAEDVFHTLQWAHYKSTADVPKNKIMKYLDDIAKMYGLQCSCCILVLAFVVIFAAVAAAQQLTQQIVAHSSGVLVTTSWTAASGGPVAMGAAVEFHPILQFPALPAATLRRLEQLAFNHQDAYHWYRVASVVRLGRTVSITANDGTALRIDGPDVYFHRSCCGEQLIDSLSSMPEDSDSLTNATAIPGRSRRAVATTGGPLNSWASYGLFSVLSRVDAKEM